MKNIKTNLKALFVALLATTMISATGATKKTSKSADLTQLINKEIGYPFSAREDGINGSVEVVFKVDQNGRISVEKADGKKELTEYVVQELDQLKIDQRTYFGRKFKTKITFKIKD